VLRQVGWIFRDEAPLSLVLTLSQSSSAPRCERPKMLAGSLARVSANSVSVSCQFPHPLPGYHGKEDRETRLPVLSGLSRPSPGIGRAKAPALCTDRSAIAARIKPKDAMNTLAIGHAGGVLPNRDRGQDAQQEPEQPKAASDCASARP